MYVQCFKLVPQGDFVSIALHLVLIDTGLCKENGS